MDLLLNATLNVELWEDFRNNPWPYVPFLLFMSFFAFAFVNAFWHQYQDKKEKKRKEEMYKKWREKY